MRLKSDNPIEKSEDDSLGRNAGAVSLDQQISSLDSSQGIVIGVLGEWGSGKTSYVNLAANELEKLRIPMVGFNPWMFSGVCQLFDAFFAEISAELKIKDRGKKLNEIGDYLSNYGEAMTKISWIPVIGSKAELLGKLAQALGKIRKKVREAHSSTAKSWLTP